jgi:hypothetical protein
VSLIILSSLFFSCLGSYGALKGGEVGNLSLCLAGSARARSLEPPPPGGAGTSMDPPPPPGKRVLVEPPPFPMEMRAPLDAGSFKDSASDAGSTATMDTSMSAGTHHTDVSAATTNFNPLGPPHVHFFNLDDFAGHEIHAILEDGEREETEDRPHGSQRESVRPGSVVSNIEQRLGDVTDEYDDQSHGEFDPGPSSSTHMGAGSSASHLASSSSTPMQHGTPEQKRMALLEQMQYRELSASDIQLLLQLEAELAAMRPDGR